MAHYAEINTFSGKVLRVVVIPNEHETDGEEYCKQLFNSNNTWLQTSYNTFAGKHRLDGTPLRKNFACIGYTYDKDLDAFVPPRPFESWKSWVLDLETCQWVSPVPALPPIPMGVMNKSVVWSEKDLNWLIIDDIDPSLVGPNQYVWMDLENGCWQISEKD